MFRSRIVQVVLCAFVIGVMGLFGAQTFGSHPEPAATATAQARAVGTDYALFGVVIVGLLLFLVRPRKRVAASLSIPTRK